MQLKLNQHYKSIKTLKETEINDFAVLVGLNGAGKTHLLEGIAKGNILVNNFQQKNISHFNFQTFLIKNQKAIAPRNIDDEKLGAWNILQKVISNIKNYDQQIKNIVGQDVNFPYSIDVPVNQKATYDQIVKNIVQVIDPHTRNNPKQKKLIMTGVFDSGKFASELSQQDFMFYSNYNPDDYELLENLSEIFVDYQKRIIIGSLDKKDGGEGLDDVEINKLYKHSPWEFVNNMFQEFGLSHRVTAPSFTIKDLIYSQSVSFQVKLTVDGDGIDFEDLSSGEKILCALAITVYQDQKSEFPSLLLLDEVDASLHPSMVKNLLNVISNVFLKNGCHVILATHSPTTVALVQSECLFEIKKNGGEKIISKIGQSEAINMLSEGYMTFDQGLKITNAVDSGKRIQILSEGTNIQHIKKAVEVLDSTLLSQIHFIDGAEDQSGKQQLKNAYQVIQGSILNTIIFLFVWDCDAQDMVDPLTESDCIKKYCFSENIENTKCVKGNKHSGIEDLYSDDLFTDDVYDTRHENLGYGSTNDKKIFSKNKFLNKVNLLTDTNTFKNFLPMVEKIKSILQSDSVL